MSLVVVGTVAFDAIETPFGKTDKIIGGAATYAGISASYFTIIVTLKIQIYIYHRVSKNANYY